MLKFADDFEELTFYTINGLSIASEFSIVIRIDMEPISSLFERNEFKEEEIPILIRSQKDGAHIQDILNLQNQELVELSKQVESLYSFINNPFTLAGCAMGTVGKSLGKSLF